MLGFSTRTRRALPQFDSDSDSDEQLVGSSQPTPHRAPRIRARQDGSPPAEPRRVRARQEFHVPEVSEEPLESVRSPASNVNGQQPAERDAQTLLSLRSDNSTAGDGDDEHVNDRCADEDEDGSGDKERNSEAAR